MTYTIQIRKGQLDVEKALENMDFDVVKFESELKMLADHQKPKVRKKLYGQYVAYMRGCGFKLSVRGIGKTPKADPVAEITPEMPVEPEIKPETTPEPAIAVEVAVQVETQKEEISVPVPQTEPVSTPTAELTPEIAPKEQPQAEPVASITNPLPDPTKTCDSPATQNATAYFTYPDASEFKRLMDAMSVLVDEVIWQFDADHLYVRHMDPSRVAMFDLKLSKAVFEEWNVTKPRLCCFNIAEVKKMVFAKPPKKDTIIGVAIDGTASRITFTLKDNRCRERSFPTLEASLEEIPDPIIAYKAMFKLVAKQMAEDIDDLNKISDHITLNGTADLLKMSAEGDLAKGSTTYKRGDDTLLDLELREESKATYSFSYMKDFIDPALCDLVKIEFSTDMPMKMTLQARFGDLIYWIAPRISTG